MKYQYESIKHQVDIPIKIFTQTIEQVPYHWHEDMEVLLILEGSLEIRIDKLPYKLKEGDLFLVNPSELHFIQSTAPFGMTKLLALQFNHEYFNKFGIDIENRSFHLYSRTSLKNKASDKLRYLLATMMDLVLNKPEYYYLKVEKTLIQFVTVLLEHFEVEHSTINATDNERLLEILKYINDHCLDSNMNVKLISDVFFMNPQYLSRYFKEQVGLSIKKFIDKTKLSKSLVALKTSNDRILDIALKYGFPDAKAYYRVFKANYDMTPMKYREHNKLSLDDGMSLDYFSINSQDSLKKVFRYLNKPKENISRSSSESKVIDLTKVLKHFENKISKLATFGYAAHGLRKDFLGQLNELQKDIGFEYIRFHGIFSDDLLVYNEFKDGSYYFNFNHIDSLLDGLINAGVKPFIELGFMPKQLASNKSRIFTWEGYISPPKKMKVWTELIDTFVRHLINRYGLDQIKSWYFEFWNEPEIETVFWSGTRKAFFDFYKVTYQTIKKIDKDIKIGGFGNAMLIRDNWLMAFNDYAIENNINLDFFSFHIYNIKINDRSVLFKNIWQAYDDHHNDMGKILKLDAGAKIGDESHIRNSIDYFIDEVCNYKAFGNEYWITEWNANTDPRDLVHDTTYMGAYIVKHVLENMEKVEGMGFWTFTDIFEEQRLQTPLFHGGFGLMTYNGLKKPGYHAYRFLNALGNQIIYKSNDMIITQKGENYQILLYNYCHPNRLYSNFDYSQISMLDRYKVFTDGEIKSISLSLLGLKGTYQVMTERCNRNSGSVFDAWVAMGAPADINDEIRSHLQARSLPDLKVVKVDVNKELNIECILEKHEIQLIQIKKIY